MELSGKTALVTGASKNIGKATAIKLAEAGADVGITALDDEDGCTDTVDEIKSNGVQSSVSLADLSNRDDIERMINDIRSDIGPIDILINNATVRPKKDFLEISEKELDYVIDVNIKGIFHTIQQTIPDMVTRKEGSIINLIGTMVYIGQAGKVHSYGTKYAIEGITRQLASEFGPYGIRVNGVSPGPIDTVRDVPLSSLESEISATPLQRIGTVDEIASVCCFLASNEASYITGQVIQVNGGLFPTPNIIK